MEFSALSTMWVLIGAALVFFMQAGFAMVETGFTRAKNAGNIIMKNLMDFSIGTPIFWLIGFGLMFGAGNGFIGSFKGIASEANYGTSMLPDGVPFYAYLIFQTVFCATAATIVSGAMAERTKFLSYCIYSFIISLVVYPIEAHWIWGGGWLANMGFHDFAGSCAVHMTGGAAALIGAKILGPRIGKYGKDGKPKAIPGHSLTLGALGCFILWFCWFGFNGCSTVSMEGDNVLLAGKVFVTTNLAAAVATVVVMIVTWIRYKKPDVSMTLNGSLAGLVAITASCDTVSPVSAAIIGAISGVIIVFGVEFVDKVLKIDDPVGAVGVHFCNGLFGTIAVGLFSDGTIELNGKVAYGLFCGGGAKLLGIQALGVVSVCAWVFATMFVVFEVIKHTIGLRASREEEILGLDLTEHNLTSSYADFMPTVPTILDGEVAKKFRKLSGGVGADGVSSVSESDSNVKTGSVSNVNSVSGNVKASVDEAVPVQLMSSPSNIASDTGVKISKVDIICKQSKFEDLKAELNKIGVMGITATQVVGCGAQKGNAKYYRGIEVDMVLLPKVKIEVVVSKVPVRDVIEAAKKALYTGNIGDGKIFVHDVENVVKVRTGEEGFDALQGEVE